jgi:hypothetical protein
MFSAVFKALLRVVNMTVVPALMAIAAVVMEWGLGLVSWFIVNLGNTVLLGLRYLLEVLPFPDVIIEEGTFGAKFMDLAEIMGIWPALTLYITAMAVVFVTRIITLGFVGK